ncbi:zinc finger protein [Sesbania bispinosa]|nr:zinc finger protein [Sesbania bispinosa]
MWCCSVLSALSWINHAEAEDFHQRRHEGESPSFTLHEMEPNCNGQPPHARRHFGAALRANKDYIKLPRTFYRQFGNELGNNVTLEDENTGICFTTTAQVFRYIGRGNFKMKIPTNNQPLDPLPWNRIRVDPYPLGYDDTTSGEDNINTNMDEEFAYGDVIESPVPSPTLTNQSNGPPQGSQDQQLSEVNGPDGTFEGQILWTNTLSDASSTGKQALVIPAKVWK